MKQFSILSCLIYMLIISTSVSAQEGNDEADADGSQGKKSRIQAGLYIGSYFANNATAYTYNGYGFDVGGNPNSFENSFMNIKINQQYGGKYGQVDEIALALGVQPGEWQFNVSDMPANMRYNVAFLVGLNGRLPVSENAAIIINANASKLTINGNFTITTIPQLNANQLQKTIKTFSIVGGEQRILLQAGYQNILGDRESQINFFVEGGLNVTMAKFDKNLIQINNLTIDLTQYFDPLNPFATASSRRPGGVGFGAFAGAGFHFTINSKSQIQLLYNPSYEQIKMEKNAPYKLQNAIGLRLFYGL